MQVMINIDESMFQNVLEKELEALKPEDLKNIITECIRNYFTQNNYEKIEKLIIQDSNNCWMNNQKVATEFTENMIKSCDYSALQNIVDSAIDCLQKNYNTLLQQVMMKLMINGITNDYRFDEKIRDAMREVFTQMNNCNN